MYHEGAQCPQWPEKGIGSPGTGVMVVVSHYVSHHVGPVRVASAHANRATSAAQKHPWNTLPEGNTFFLPVMADTHLLRNLLLYFYSTYQS